MSNPTPSKRDPMQDESEDGFSIDEVVPGCCVILFLMFLVGSMWAHALGWIQ